MVAAWCAPVNAVAGGRAVQAVHGVTCPASLGAGYEFDPGEGYESVDDPTWLALFCSYTNVAESPDRAVVEIQVLWSEQRPSYGCGAEPEDQEVRSATHYAHVTWGTGNAADPPGLSDAVATLLAQAEAVAVPCGGATAQPTTTVAAPTTSTTAGTRKELCAEARVLIEGFSPAEMREAGITDPTKTGLHVDGDDLAADMFSAVDRYNAAHPDAAAYVSDGTPFAGEIGATNWLFGFGGGIKGPQADAYVTGTERQLQTKLIALAERGGKGDTARRLTPGEVLEVALDLNGGHLNQALLAAHNLLRANARSDTLSADLPLYDNGFVDRYLVPLRDGENGGPWYHMFGTAYFEVVAQGDWGPWLATGAVAAAWGAGMLSGGATLLLGGVALAWQNESDASGTTAASRVANGVEQIVRENWSGQRPDPEKFCFNVWAAQIGKRLYERLPYKSSRPFRALLSSYPVPESAPAIDPLERFGEPNYVNAMGSPFSVWWSDGTLRMLLDQGEGLDARLVGGVPGMMLPVPEDDSWGLVWIDPEHSGQLVSFAAREAGAVLHYRRTDTRTGETAIYEATATAAGEQFSMNLDPATVAPVLMREDGEIIEPRMVTLDLNASSTDEVEGSLPPATDSAVTEAVTAPPREEQSSHGLGSLFVLAIMVIVAAAGVIVGTRVRRPANRP